jgi:hypothetical protein
MLANSLAFHQPRRVSFRIVLAAAAVISAQPASSAVAGDVFAAFAGSFRGAGEVVMTDGHRERIACRATGAVANGGRNMAQTIVCASDSYKFDIRGEVMASGSQVSGDWRETTRGVTGAITGRVVDDHFNGVVNGEGFTAGFSLRVSGRRLAFGLRPSNSDIVRVDVTLSR